MFVKCRSILEWISELMSHASAGERTLKNTQQKPAMIGGLRMNRPYDERMIKASRSRYDGLVFVIPEMSL